MFLRSTSSRWEQRISNDSYKSKQGMGKTHCPEVTASQGPHSQPLARGADEETFSPESLQRALHLGCLRSTLKGCPPYRTVQQCCGSCLAACDVTAVQDVTEITVVPTRLPRKIVRASQRGDEARLHRVRKGIRRKETTKRFRAKEKHEAPVKITVWEKRRTQQVWKQLGQARSCHNNPGTY